MRLRLSIMPLLFMSVGTAAADVPANPDPAAAVAEFSTYCAKGRTVWGKSLCGPLLLVDPATKTAIASFDPQLAGFKRDGAVWTGPLPKDLSIANTSVDFAGRRVAEILLPLPSDEIERRILLSHESFHRMQPELGFKAKEADNGHLDARQARIYARLEVAALKAALTQNNWRAAASDALAYRASRLAQYPDARSAEGSLVANEGLAEYTGIRVGAGPHATDLAVRRLDGAASRPSLIRSFGYVVGPVYGLLLDRTGKSWRSAALKGTPLPDLLGTWLGNPATPRTAGSQYGGELIVAEETARDEKIQRRRSELVAKLVEGPTVTFAFEKMNIDFNPDTLFSLGPTGTVYSEATRIRDNWGSLRAAGDVLLSADWSYARLPGPAKVNGRTVSGPGWSAELADRYTVVAGKRTGDFLIEKQ
jgi:hypothetical protein